MDVKYHVMNFVLIVCMVLLLCCLNVSEANDCGDQPTRCPHHFTQCYCPHHTTVKFHCVNGQWEQLPCGVTDPPTTGTTQPPTPEPTCHRLQAIPFGIIKYSVPLHRSNHDVPLGTKAKYTCKGYGSHTKYTRICGKNGWSDTDPIHVCSCGNPPVWSKLPQPIVDPPPDRTTSESRYAFTTTATYYCTTTHKIIAGIMKCTNNGNKGKWIGNLNLNICFSKIKPTTKVRNIYDTSTTTESPLHHNEERTVVIVSGTTGAILGALIILVVIVSCQRRLHYHRMRRARLRHRQDQDAFSAFITYHRDVHLMLPSYDEAVNQQEQGQPPSFEEALGHYEEPTLPPGHTPAGENPPSISTDSSNSSDSRSSETLTTPENSPDPPLFNGQSPVFPTSENSRFLRTIRTLFGGRAFRPDAIYCRFVPEEDESESSRREEREPRSSEGDDELTDVLAQAGLC